MTPLTSKIKCCRMVNTLVGVWTWQLNNRAPQHFHPEIGKRIPGQWKQAKTTRYLWCWQAVLDKRVLVGVGSECL